MPEHDLVILGGGSAGYAAARTAVQQGLRTAVVDGAEELGGLCILRGCMPSKAILESTNRFASMRRAREFGLSAQKMGVDRAAIRERKRRLIAEFAEYRQGQLENDRFDLIRGHARFTSPHEVEVALRDGGHRALGARAFVIATGSEIQFPEVPGLTADFCITSDDVLEADTLPASLIVLGGGPVALELAWFHQGLGVPVTVIQRSPQVLSGEDEDVARAVESGLARHGTICYTGTRLDEIIRNGGEDMEVRFTHKGSPAAVRAATVLAALGRQPATANLGLEAAGVETEGLRILADNRQATSQPHIFAAGDACGPEEIVHIAIEQGEIAAAQAAALVRGEANPEHRIDPRLLLFAMFTQPEMARAGMTERQAREAGREISTATYPFDDHGKSLVMGETDGFVKLIADTATGELLGGAVVGPHASELIHEVVVTLRYHATAADFARIPHYHPTLAEIWTYPAEELAGSTGDADS